MQKQIQKRTNPQHILKCVECFGFGGIILVSLWFRIWKLGSIPGINGDEAWYGVQANRLIHGSGIPMTTPALNVINPFYFGLLCLIQLISPNQFWVLRAPAVVSGLALLVATYVLVKKARNRLIATMATLLLAIMPVNIVYSRFGWDSSQSVLIGLMVWYFWYQKKRWWLMAVLVIAFIIHPTNVFSVGIIAVAELVGRLRKLRQVTRVELIFLVGLALVGLVIFQLFQHLYHLESWGGVTSRITNINQTADFIGLWGDLMSGVSVYGFVAGVGIKSGVRIVATVFWTLVTVVFLVYWHDRKGFNQRQRDYFLALLITGYGFYLISGTHGLMPHYERYALWMVFPVMITAAEVIAMSLQNTVHKHRLIFSIMIVTTMWLSASWRYYFQPLLKSKGSQHRTFRTSQIEPKKQAYDWIENYHTQVLVIAEDWWIYWPIKYLSLDQGKIEVVLLDDYQKLHGSLIEPSDIDTFLVGFEEGAFENQLTTVPEHQIQDNSGKIILKIWKI